MKQKHHEEVNALPGNPFPNALTVIPKRGEDVEKVAALFKARPTLGIDKVDYGKQTTHRVLKLAHVIEIFFIIAVALLLVASTLLIANTIRLSIFSRRREIEVMKLVGATNWFVRGPFMLEGLACGVFGAVGAVLLLLLGKEVAGAAILDKLNSTQDVHAWSFPLTAAIIFTSALLLGAAGALRQGCVARGAPLAGRAADDRGSPRSVHRAPRPGALPPAAARDDRGLLRHRADAAAGPARPRRRAAAGRAGPERRHARRRHDRRDRRRSRARAGLRRSPRAHSRRARQLHRPEGPPRPGHGSAQARAQGVPGA